MVKYRALRRDEIPAIWAIERRERIERIFVAGASGLELVDAPFDVPGWEAGRPAAQTPVFEASFDAGAWFYGAFDGGRIAGIAVLEPMFFGLDQDTLQLSFLHVTAELRGMGVGRQLFESARTEAKSRGARRMYVSATPTERTVEFYLARGCELLAEPDPSLFALEPEDIHLICAV
ncbi:MAG TPA: GNAT family N-acetyltransferase [Tepidiformaceae bacterium]|nr:GNAT family N-acetyltransferase [Tepidiformaceae bacterium]